MNWKQIGINELKESKELLKLFYADYKETFEDPCTSCKSKLEGYYIKLINNKQTKMSTIARFKTGVQIYDRTDMKMYDNRNLTDDVAKRLLTEVPDRAKMFEVMPDEGSQQMNVKETIKLINGADTEEEVNELLGDDERITVKKAAAKRIAELG